MCEGLLHPCQQDLEALGNHFEVLVKLGEQLLELFSNDEAKLHFRRDRFVFLFVLVRALLLELGHLRVSQLRLLQEVTEVPIWICGVGSGYLQKSLLNLELLDVKFSEEGLELEFFLAVVISPREAPLRPVHGLRPLGWEAQFESRR